MTDQSTWLDRLLTQQREEAEALEQPEPHDEDDTDVLMRWFA